MIDVVGCGVGALEFRGIEWQTEKRPRGHARDLADRRARHEGVGGTRTNRTATLALPADLGARCLCVLQKLEGKGSPS